MVSEELLIAIKELTPAQRTEIVVYIQDLSCINCAYFSEPKCNKYGSNPPAKFISSGCKHFKYMPDYFNDDIPF